MTITNIDNDSIMIIFSIDFEDSLIERNWHL